MSNNSKPAATEHDPMTSDDDSDFPDGDYTDGTESSVGSASVDLHGTDDDDADGGASDQEEADVVSPAAIAPKPPKVTAKKLAAPTSTSRKRVRNKNKAAAATPKPTKTLPLPTGGSGSSKVSYVDFVTMAPIAGATVSSAFAGKVYTSIDAYKTVVSSGSTVSNDVYVKVVWRKWHCRGVRVASAGGSEVVHVITDAANDRLAITSNPLGDTRLTMNFATQVCKAARGGTPLKATDPLTRVFGQIDAATGELPPTMNVALAEEIRSQACAARNKKRRKTEHRDGAADSPRKKAAPSKSRKPPTTQDTGVGDDTVTVAENSIAESVDTSVVKILVAYEDAGKAAVAALAKLGVHATAPGLSVATQSAV